ncbi:hypothetical protein F4777DRAFT_277050 [Nemania sp. FL0916]|nr:hypothetical protein F4777DRAFT_277050 [Nemania sp. FL0916]
MERDSRRDRGEWRGCHNFDKIICDGDRATNSERRGGGLKMGQRYYYYYEVDGSIETYNSSLPTTTACPFLPGQTVNTLDVPLERRARLKSASMSSLRSADYKTMDPVDRFTTPRPKPTAQQRREIRIASGSTMFPKRAARSVSPAPSWKGTARRILGFKSHNREKEAERGRNSTLSEVTDMVVEEQEQDLVPPSRSATPSGSIRSRELSPESLRRFLSDDLPSCSGTPEPTPCLSIPDDIEEEVEDNDDDDNFATESSLFTNLSPPPFQRGLSAPPARHTRSPAMSTPTAPTLKTELTFGMGSKSSSAPKLEIPRSHSTISTASSSLASAVSPCSNVSQGLSQVSFFDDSDDDEELAYEGDQILLEDRTKDKMGDDAETMELRAPITSYSLPGASIDTKPSGANRMLESLESPSLVARADNDVPIVTNNFLALTNVDIGLDDFVGDANWMNDVLRQKEL